MAAPDQSVPDAFAEIAEEGRQRQELQDNAYARVPATESYTEFEMPDASPGENAPLATGVRNRHVVALAMLLLVVAAAACAGAGVIVWPQTRHAGLKAADANAFTQDFEVTMGMRPARHRIPGSKDAPGPLWTKKDTPTEAPQEAMPALPWTQDEVLGGSAESYTDLLRRAPAESNFYLSLQHAIGYSVTGLNQEAFKEGPYVITQPGVYKLLEDIVFEPNKHNNFAPLRDQEPYTFDKGYWLGFYAAIVIQASNVLIDLNGKTISMSQEFLLRQRYFSIIELSSKPYKSITGPPVLGYLHDQITASQGVTIYNGVLGLSSHMGLHGTDNAGVWLDRVVIRDFEVGGIQLNGASNVHLSNVHVGPSLGAPGSAASVPGTARFSLAQFMLSTVKNTGIEWAHEFAMLESSAQEFIADRFKAEPMKQSIFDDPGKFTGLPDGGAVYGIHFHTTGPAVHDFDLCSAAQQKDLTVIHKSFHLTNVVIQDLHIKTDEVVRMVWQGRPLTGIAGESFQGVQAARDDGMYTGNDFVEAQLAFQKLKNANTPDTQVNYGNVSLPHEVLDWVAGNGTLADLERAGLSYDCHVDAMGHSNKGAIGLRLDGVDSVTLMDVAIKGLKNFGTRGPSHIKCRSGEGDFKGSDVRGISLSNVASLQGSSVDISWLESVSGMAMGVEVRHGDENIHLSGLHTSHLRGENGQLRNAMAYVARHETGGININEA